MKRNEMDNQIKNLLQHRADAYKVPEESWMIIERKLNQREGEKNNMKKFSVKKAVIAAAVAVMLTGTVCLAAGSVVTKCVNSSSIPDYRSYQDLSKAEEKTGVKTNAPEKFENGYSFNGIHIKSERGLDKNDVVVDEYQSLAIHYEMEGKVLTLNVEPRMTERLEDDFYTQILEEDGVKYYYKVLKNKFVPVEYVPTAEEESQMAAGDLNIGIGADKVTESTSYMMSWTYNNQTYELFTMDVSLTAEEMLAMAREIQ